ncbi:hypothetical protein [Oerskovia enterophila]
MRSSGVLELGGGEWLLLLVAVGVVWPVGTCFALRTVLGLSGGRLAFGMLGVAAIGLFPWVAIAGLSPRDVVFLAFAPALVGGFVAAWQARPGGRALWGVSGLLAITSVILLWGASSRGVGQLPDESGAQAAGEVLLATALRLPAAWMGALLVLVGVVCALLDGRGRSWVWVHLAVGVAYVLAAAPGIPVVGAATLTWLPSAPLMAACLGVSGTFLGARGAAELTTSAQARIPWTGVRTAVGVAMVVVVVVLSGRGLISAVITTGLG